MKYFTHSEGHRINVKCQFFFSAQEATKKQNRKNNFMSKKED